MLDTMISQLEEKTACAALGELALVAEAAYNVWHQYTEWATAPIIANVLGHIASCTPDAKK